MTDTRPPLVRDRAFIGLVATQFLGAFNDNVFKQMVLLIGLDYAASKRLSDDPYQAFSSAMFALAFILFSGFAGWLSDRYSKRTTIVVCKVAEIVVMSLGALVFYFVPNLGESQMTLLIVVLFLMGTHSAFFGPSKYGILPEMFRDRDLPIINGIVQMTTFLAIISGTVVCGFLLDALKRAGIGLWTVSATCIVIAIVGTLTSLLLRPTPAAQPGLAFHPATLAMDRPTFRLLWGDKKLLYVMGAYVLFWFLGGVALLVANAMGKEQFALGDFWTSMLTASIALGIAFGCVISGSASRTRINFRLVLIGAWGMLISMSSIALVSPVLSPAPEILQFRRADTLRVVSQFDSAVNEYRELLEADDQFVEGWVGLGLSYRGLEQQARETESDLATAHQAEAEAAFSRASALAAEVVIPEEPTDDFAADIGAAELIPIKIVLALLLAMLGLSAGLFAVPLQVFMQHRPPRELKGRMIAAMNLLTWIGILASSGTYDLCAANFTTQNITWTFLVLAVMILPVSLFYRPEDEELKFE